MARTLAILLVLTTGVLVIASTASADAYKRPRAKPKHHDGHSYAARFEQSQWYVSEYPYPNLTVRDETYARCRIGWWQSSYHGHPRPQWATLCRR